MFTVWTEPSKLQDWALVDQGLRAGKFKGIAHTMQLGSFSRDEFFNGDEAVEVGGAVVFCAGGLAVNHELLAQHRPELAAVHQRPPARSAPAAHESCRAPTVV